MDGLSATNLSNLRKLLISRIKTKILPSNRGMGKKIIIFSFQLGIALQLHEKTLSRYIALF